MKEDKKHTNPKAGAQAGDSIDAENVTVSTSQTGEESLDAEGKRDKDAEFDALIKNEYKEQFTKKVQKIISKRFKEVNSVKNEKDTLTEEKKVELIKRLIVENRALKKRFEEEKRTAEVKNRADEIRNQVEETKKAYPDFDFENEIKNPEFARLLKAGVKVKDAYEVINIDSILDRNSKDAEKKVVDSIRAKSNRPAENGGEGGSGILLSGNASKLTKKQRADLAKRAAKGEKISF